MWAVLHRWLFFVLFFFCGTEYFLLGAVTYDCYAVVCSHLSYPEIMNRRVFMKWVICSWAMGFILGTVQTSWVSDFPFCGPIEMSHIYYETPAVLELALQTPFFFFFFNLHIHWHGLFNERKCLKEEHLIIIQLMFVEHLECTSPCIV